MARPSKGSGPLGQDILGPWHRMVSNGQIVADVRHGLIVVETRSHVLHSKVRVTRSPVPDGVDHGWCRLPHGSDLSADHQRIIHGVPDAVYYEVKISAETRAQADAILNSLLDKRLATGGQFIAAPARFLWKGEIHDMDYVTITSYTLDRNRDLLVEDVRRTTSEEVPMITFTAIDHLNDELQSWIAATLS